MINDKKIMKFDLSPRNLKVKKLLNQDFLVIEMKAISNANPNRNKSYFTKESMEKAIPTFYNKPVLSSFNVNLDDFRGHEGELKYDSELDQLYYDYTDAKSETPLGLIRSEDKVELVKDEVDGLYWIKFTCALWVKYGHKQIKRLLKSRTGNKKISVEIEVKDSYTDDRGIEVITEFVFDGVTILSDKLETGIADAELTILDKITDAVFQKKTKCLTYAYNDLEKLNSEFSSADNDNIDNENSEEINMNQRGGDTQMLTYGQKREILESYLRDILKSESEENCIYIWVADIDEQYVYFEYQENTYKAIYSITGSEDGETVATVDLENKVQVIRSWANFAEDNSVEKKENESKELEDNKETESKNPEDKKEEESKSEEKKEEESKEPEGQKEEESKEPEDTKEEESKSDGEDSKEGSEKQIEAKNDSESKKEEEVKSEEDNKEDSKKFEANPDNASEEKHEVLEFVSIGEEQVDITTLAQKFTELSTQYESLKTQYSSTEVELNKYKEAEKKANIESMITFAKNIVDSEDGLEDSEKETLNTQIKSDCEAEKFATKEDIKTFTINSVAVMLYTKKLNDKPKKTKEFSIPFTASEKGAENEDTETGIKKLQRLSKQLEKI